MSVPAADVQQDVDITGKSHPRFIDVHMHFLPDCYRQALDSAGLKTLDGGMPIPEWSEDLALATMDRLGIETAMLSISSPSVRFVQGAAELKLCRDVNRAGADLVKRRPDRFGLLATLPMLDVAGAVDEANFVLDELGADGVVIETNIRGTYLGDPELAPLFDELNRREIVVFLHPTSPACFASLASGRPAPLIEFPIDTTRAVVDLLYSGTLKRCPGLKLIVPHGGGAIPVLAPRIAAFASRSFIDPKPSDQAEVFRMLASLHYDVVQSGHPAPFSALCRIAKIENLLFGSDWPFGPAEGVARNFASIAAAGLSAGELAMIARDNALRLFPRLARQSACGCPGAETRIQATERAAS